VLHVVMSVTIDGWLSKKDKTSIWSKPCSSAILFTTDP